MKKLYVLVRYRDFEANAFLFGRNKYAINEYPTFKEADDKRNSLRKQSKTGLDFYVIYTYILLINIFGFKIYYTKEVG